MTISQRVEQWKQKTKKRALIYKGCGCVVCGYSTSTRSLIFHHLDPRLKDFGVGSGVRSWERLVVELDKCVLLCANCHGEVHDEITTIICKGPTPKEGLELVRMAGLETYHPQPRHQRHCPTCGTDIGWAASGCHSCISSKQKTKINWPSSDVLAAMVKASSARNVAKQLGVSDRSVAKRLRNHS